jgi:hypothetical protein
MLSSAIDLTSNKLCDTIGFVDNSDFGNLYSIMLFPLELDFAMGLLFASSI